MLFTKNTCRDSIDLALAVRPVDEAGNYGKFSYPVKIPGNGLAELKFKNWKIGENY